MKIYIACLASYNNGTLHGKWIDAESDVDAMQSEVNAMLRASPYPNVIRSKWHCADCGEDVVTTNSYTGAKPVAPACEHCSETMTFAEEFRSAEEFAIHDFEGLPSSFGEYCGLQTVADFVELTEEFDHMDSDDLALMLSDFSDVAEFREALRDEFVGTFDSFRAYSDEAADEMLSAHDIKDDNPVSRYFDYESWSRDLKMDMRVIQLGAGVAVFHA